MLLVPGIDTINGFRAINHASAIWAGVAPSFFAPNVVRSSMIGWLFFMTMGEKRGNVARRSFFGSKVDCTSKIGRASCRERVCQYGEISVGVVSLKKKN